MADIELMPGVLQGAVNVPPSKSVLHRALICAGLAKGVSTVTPIELSQDIDATIRGLSALGADVKINGNAAVITGAHKVCCDIPLIDCGQSGSTLRFFIPIVSALFGEGRFLAHGRLNERPLMLYENTLAGYGIELVRASADSNETGLIKMRGHLGAGEYMLPGNVSSQFASGLLLALGLCSEESIIRFSSPVESRGYIDLTLQIMSAFGIKTQSRSEELHVLAGNEYIPQDFYVEGDYSQGAVFLCAAALMAARGFASKLVVSGLSEETMQGDSAVLGYLTKMGAKWQRSGGNIVFCESQLHGITIDAAQHPDIMPIMALTLALSHGEGAIHGAYRLRFKECDRLSVTVNELHALGADITESGDGMRICGMRSFCGDAEVFSHDDHRMAMMLSVAALFCDKPILLRGSEAVGKSWPVYWQVYNSLREVSS